MAELPRVNPTPRGLRLLVLGAAAVVLGVLVGIPIVTQWGLVLLGVVGLGIVWLSVSTAALGRGGVRIERRVTPHPTVVGRPATVRVDLTAAGHVLDSLEVEERAAPELTGVTAPRARLRRTPGRVTLVYRIDPVRRGRWPVGPLHIHRRDPFGVADLNGPLGRPVDVAVRPRTVELPAVGRSFAMDLDRSATGARAPSTDDVALRPYRTGDDLRRVHWRSSARRGELVVRQDERAARRPASVLLDLPLDDAAAEWSISLACSVALALSAAGHHVRLLAGDLDGAVAHLQPDPDGLSGAMILDQAIDLTTPLDTAQRQFRVTAALEQITAHPGPEIVVAVLGALAPDSLATLAGLGQDGTARALIRVGRPGDPSITENQAATARALERSGWVVATVSPGEDIAGTWQRLVARDPVGMLR